MSTYWYGDDEKVISPFDIRLLYIALSEDELNWHATLHTHHCMELFYITAGAGRIQLEDLSFAVKTGDIVVINPNVAHMELREGKTPMNFLVAGLEGGEFLTENGNETGYCLLKGNEHSEEILRYMKEMLSEYTQKEPYYIEIAHRTLEILCLKLFRQQHILIQKLPKQKNRQVCSKVRQYLDRNYWSDITLDSLAEMFHMNKYYLAHTFSDEFGISPINYMVQRRIDESRNLLTTTDYSVSLIAELLGFSSPSYFTQCFQRLADCSPSQYRKKVRAESAE